MADTEANRGSEVPRFDRDFFASGVFLTRIGDGELGGKGKGLLRAHDHLVGPVAAGRFGPYEVRIPRTIVLATGVFDSFVVRNGLDTLAREEAPDPVVARAFLDAALPTEILGDLRALVGGLRVPLAVRSSSLLEDSLARPFAGVYETKMTPNDQADPDERFRRFVEAVKLVYASTYFQAARIYARAVGRSAADEKMAVVIQEIVGSRRGARFYPMISGVGRSYDFYASGSGKPEDGAMSLALGLGRTIVDGGACWTYSPARPKAPSPYGSVQDLLRQSQNRFWAVRMGKPPVYDPLDAAEYLVAADLGEAELDGVLDDLASTYDSASDRLVPGTGRPGPRVLDFAPILRLGTAPFNTALRELLAVCREAEGADVEIEVAADWARPSEPPVLGLVQMRPMAAAAAGASFRVEELVGDDVLLGSRRVVGHGLEMLSDVVYVRPESFDPAATRQIAAEIGEANARLVAEGRPYLLIGFGRWGTSDPWGGIPVRWEQVGGARSIVEVSLPSFQALPSQGSHFFHNVTSLQVLYFGLDLEEASRLRWDRLRSAVEVARSDFVRQVRISPPLRVEVDGRNRIGRIVCPPPGRSEVESQP